MIKYANKTITVYNYSEKDNTYYSTILNSTYIEDNKRVNIMRYGIENADKVYISIRDISKYKNYKEWLKLTPTEKAEYFTIQDKSRDFVVQGSCQIEIDTSNGTTTSNSLKSIRDIFITYEITSYSEKLSGSKRIRHIEVGGV